ncbi:MAG: hypothetical protein E7L01_26500 [Paenibacillus macerans]|uniref:Putative membrane protein n=1 Tax=Paenibacillus macerans TaxID=44252 RepID=A0A090YUL1_PAEMA|nr:hypothetical protein [Paenibacillus macerans]KFM95785.1 putative membrane protein [Paenibacillus macerans]MBS5912625.1 hypothetical protein [Paenibacillus macerans]MCY7560522.1 hypothetical protein [Paenibacillus macerans]MDU7476864.1 hypothetical protein [Paenibacillus macerans]MEC0140696.1 hypothetical protein [Paenibacillus macerans]
MSSSFKLYASVYLIRIKYISWRDIVLTLFLLLLLLRGTYQFTTALAEKGFSSTFITGCWGLIGMTVGIGLFAGNLMMAEMRFLWSLGRGARFLTSYMIWKKSPFVLVLVWMLLGQLLWSPSYSFGQAFLMLLLGLSFAELGVYCFVALSGMARERTAGSLSLALLLLTVLALNISLMMLPMIPAVRLIVAIAVTLLQYIAAFQASRFSWPRMISAAPPAESGAKRHILSRYPLLRKEVYFLTRFKDMFPFLIAVCLLQLFTYYSAVDTPIVVPVGAALMVWLVSDVWVIRSFVAEGRGIALYTVTLGAWNRGLWAKWLFYGTVGISMFIVHTLIWGFRLDWTWTAWSFFELLAQCLLLTSTFVSFSLLAGYHLTTQGRISLPAQLLITICMFLLIYLHQAHQILFIIVSITIQFGFYRLLRQVPESLPGKFSM